ncbi:MAG: ABC transporter permease [Planctomycetes bacterium]|nr:ABC transporter permease [Planctomycetota bacterium]
MLLLAWANLTHRKVRSFLSILAVAIAITLLLILVGLSRGTLNEVSGRMQSVQAEIVVRDRHFDLGSMSGAKLWEKEITQIMEIQIDGNTAVTHVIPVFLGRMKLAGLSQNVFGVCPADFIHFAGPKMLIEGAIFTDIETPKQALSTLEAGFSPTDDFILPLIIDQRLSFASGLKIGDDATYGDRPSKIIAIAPTGVAGRVFAPINMLRAINGIGSPTAHMFFVKANPKLNTSQLQKLCESIDSKIKRSATLVANYHQVLADNFRYLTIFVTLISVIALIICFLFILVTMYTIVLERSKEIAILQSLGADRRHILTQTIQEALLICSLGAVLGILFAFFIRWIIQTVQPLMTVEMKAGWIGIAVCVALGGGTLSALYPAYMALRRDPVETLSFE